jgi:hypothetical protein
VDSLSERDKEQLKVWISKGTDERFREFVERRYPIFMRGHLSIEVERALIEYMGKGGSQGILRK